MRSVLLFILFSSRRRHTRLVSDWSSDVCSSDLKSRFADLLRLNVAIPPSSNPSALGILGGDLAGFPNGRRLADDIVAIELRAVRSEERRVGEGWRCGGAAWRLKEKGEVRRWEGV